MSDLGTQIEGACAGAVVGEIEACGELTIEIARDKLLDVARHLVAEPHSFALLSDLTCADFPEERGRFRVAYHLFSLASGSRVRLRVWAGSDSPEVPSVTSVWPTANWHEREVYDMFGVRFTGHPDLARILMPDDWVGHPLRKDYPIGGEEVVFSDAV